MLLTRTVFRFWCVIYFESLQLFQVQIFYWNLEVFVFGHVSLKNKGTNTQNCIWKQANLGLSDCYQQVWIKINVPFLMIGIQWSRGISLGRCLYSVVHRIPQSQHPENSDRFNILMFASGSMLRKGGLKSSSTAALYLNNRCMLLWQGVSMGLLDFGSANILFRLNSK